MYAAAARRICFVQSLGNLAFKGVLWVGLQHGV